MKSFILLTSLLLTALNAAAINLPPGFVGFKIASYIDPTCIAEGPDGKMLVTDKSGKLYLIKNRTFNPTPVLSITVDEYVERGVQSVLFDPGFETNHFIYLYYAVPGEHHNRLSRYTMDGDQVLESSETVLLDFEILGAGFHNGGGMFFGKDGKLYLCTGDGGIAAKAQDKNSLFGKVLRMNTDGSAPEDNPYYNELEGNFRLIYCLGLRNPFKAKTDTVTGQMFFNDVGDASFEEINQIESGRNYGWPITEGYATTQTLPEAYKDPLHAYDHTTGCAITAGGFYNPPVQQFPEEYKGKYFFADVCHAWIKYIDPEIAEVKNFASAAFQPLDLFFAKDGSMYLLVRGGSNNNQSLPNGSIFLIQYDDSGEPSIAMNPVNQVSPEGEYVTFAALANGEEPLQHQWFRDGDLIPDSNNDTLAIGPVSLADNGSTYYLKVSNNKGEAVTDTVQLTVSDNTPPVGIITAPESNYFYKGGDTVYFAGSGQDQEDGSLTAEAFTWKIDFHHNQHAHPALTSTSGLQNGTYIIPSIGETSTNVWYRIYLTVKDSEGFTHTTYQDIHPVTSVTTLNTSPSGLQLILDGAPVQTPYSFTGVAGIQRTIEITVPQEKDGKIYSNGSWQHGGEKAQTLHTPEVDTEILASFTLLSIEEAIAKGPSIYPNPGSGKFYIEFYSLTSGQTKLSLTDANGRKKFKMTTQVNQGFNKEQLDLIHLSSGIYLLTLTYPDGLVHTKKLVVSRP